MLPGFFAFFFYWALVTWSRKRAGAGSNEADGGLDRSASSRNDLAERVAHAFSSGAVAELDTAPSDWTVSNAVAIADGRKAAIVAGRIIVREETYEGAESEARWFEVLDS